MKCGWPSLHAFAILSVLCLFLPAAEAANHPPRNVPDGYERVGLAMQRLHHDLLDIQVHHGSEQVVLPRFHELAIVQPVREGISLDRLIGRTVLLVPSQKHESRWDVYAESLPALHSVVIRPAAFQRFAGVRPTDGLALPDNLYRVLMVLVSTGELPVTLDTYSEHIVLKPGESLLVLR